MAFWETQGAQETRTLSYVSRVTNNFTLVLYRKVQLYMERRTHVKFSNKNVNNLVKSPKVYIILWHEIFSFLFEGNSCAFEQAEMMYWNFIYAEL
jgi:hypothetical protein